MTAHRPRTRTPGVSPVSARDAAAHMEAMTAATHTELDDDLVDDADDERDPEWGQPYRDGLIHVLAEKCSTCVFHPGNRMNLRPGRLRDMVDSVKANEAPFRCHQTLSFGDSKYREHYAGEALCRGSYDLAGDDSYLMRYARGLGIIEEVDPYPDDNHGKDEKP